MLRGDIGPDTRALRLYNSEYSRLPLLRRPLLLPAHTRHIIVGVHSLGRGRQTGLHSPEILFTRCLADFLRGNGVFRERRCRRGDVLKLSLVPRRQFVGVGCLVDMTKAAGGGRRARCGCVYLTWTGDSGSDRQKRGLLQIGDEELEYCTV